ncbi:UDP-glucose 4-epimerase family protein [Herbaspirillum seropedicae]|uniref:UDP-glucose 4-epimerase family protein n=1 Tax=Herbaspirillum seropedicae TaxID=964 RepID=UPI003F8D3F07
MPNILITGANGFIGNAIVSKLVANDKDRVRVAIRKASRHFPETVEVHEGIDLAGETDWTRALQDIDVVIHCAARVHVMRDTSTNPLSDFRKINTEGTLNLARQAQAAGVKRFIFLSSLGVNGESTTDAPFKADDTPHPHSPYTQSKLEAETALMELTRGGPMSAVIIRPPLVYGPNAPGNFGSLIRVVNKRLPLPLGAVANKRSFVFLDNLVDMIICCVQHPNAANQTFLVSDDEDLSTTQLLRKIGNALGKPTLLLPVPTFMLHAAAKCLGKGKVAQQLLGSLQVDIEKTKTMLNWKPPVSVDDALRKTGATQR